MYGANVAVSEIFVNEYRSCVHLKYLLVTDCEYLNVIPHRMSPIVDFSLVSRGDVRSIGSEVVFSLMWFQVGASWSSAFCCYKKSCAI